MAGCDSRHNSGCGVPSWRHLVDLQTSNKKGSQMITLSDLSSTLGSIFFATSLGFVGLILGYILCRRASK
jgi:hypothetical protein